MHSREFLIDLLKAKRIGPGLLAMLDMFEQHERRLPFDVAIDQCVEHSDCKRKTFENIINSACRAGFLKKSGSKKGGGKYYGHNVKVKDTRMLTLIDWPKSIEEANKPRVCSFDGCEKIARIQTTQYGRSWDSCRDHLDANDQREDERKVREDEEALVDYMNEYNDDEEEPE